MHGEADGLAEGGGGAVGEGHEPWFRGAVGERQGGDAGAEGEAFEGLVEGDGDEEDDEGGADGEGEGEPDEDGVEEDAGFEEEALQEEFLRVGGGRGWG